MSKHLIDPDKCTACTVCVAHCPVTAATRKFRGPKMTGPALERIRMQVSDEDNSLQYCSNCKNCDMSCPSGVPISTLNMIARANYHKKHKQQTCDDMLAHGEGMGKLATAVPGLSSMINLGMKVGKGLGMMGVVGLANEAPLPPFASESFYAKFKRIKQTSFPQKVVFYPGCFINTNQPEVGVALVEVFQKNNIEVIVDEDFVCCGSPLVTGGYLDEAKQNADKNLSIIKKWTEKGYPVITACTSCGLMLKQEYQELFHLDADEVNAKNMYDAIEYLEILNEEGKLNTEFKTTNAKLIYHSPCHLRAQGFGLPSMEVLSLVPGVEIENADAGCCGISGSYGMKADKYEIGMKVGSKLFNSIKESSAETVVCECGTCRIQITHGSGAKAIHPLQVLNQAYK